MFDMKSATKALLDGCVLPGPDGLRLFTPDGKGNYPSLWTRDFAYMVESAGDLMDPAAVKACIDCTLARATETGWIPDRVDTAGEAFYTAGDAHFPALPNLDNGPFVVFSAEAYLRQLPAAAAAEQFAVWEQALCAGLDCLPTDENGLIENNTRPPHSPYGFTDCICKTGVLCLETLLLWRALRMLTARLSGEKAAQYAALTRRQEAVFCATFTEDSGMLRAATGIGRQTDLWASCYAVSIGFPLPEAQKAAIADWFAAHYDTVVEAGQLRHLPAGQDWEQTFVPVPSGTYQNGAFWATPTGWLYDTLRTNHPALAQRTLQEVLRYFETEGIFECVNGTYRKLDTYVASATNVYAACLRAGLV